MSKGKRIIGQNQEVKEYIFLSLLVLPLRIQEGSKEFSRLIVYCRCTITIQTITFVHFYQCGALRLFPLVLIEILEVISDTILEKEKLRLRKVKYCAQGLTAY